MLPSFPLQKIYSATLRALSKHPKAHVNLEADSYPPYRLYKEQVTIGISTSQTALLRGITDSNAYYLRFHNEEIHKQYLPSHPMARAIYDAAEWARVESIAMQHLPGLKKNISTKIAYDIKKMPLITNEHIPYPEIIRLLILNHTVNIPLKGQYEALFTRLEPTLLPHLKKLHQCLKQQEKFAQEVKLLLSTLLNDEFPKETVEEPTFTSPEEENPSSSIEPPTSTPADSPEGIPTPRPTAAAMTAPVASPPTDSSTAEEYQLPSQLKSYPIRNAETPYHAYTTEFDEIVSADELCSDAELNRLRKQLESRLALQPDIPKPHANKLLRKLQSQQRASWYYNLDEGLIDSARLAQVIVDPNYPSFYKQRVQAQQYNTIVTLLLDNSGSMRGRPITLAAMSAELLAKLLELCGIKVEILGFTTVEWKGGKSRDRWQQEGSPLHPGRLNDLRHILYKAADTPWRKAKKHMGLMLKEGILKENIDGEAITWAYSRLRTRPEQRKILMVISDGAPVDDSTLSTNHTSYLDDHLKQIVSSIEQEKKIELIAIGIGHDVSRYYQHAVTIKDAKDLSDTMFKELSKIFENTDMQTPLMA